MGANDFLQRLAQSFITRTNAANGNTAIARDEAAAQDASMMRRAQAAQIAQRLGFAPQEHAANMEYKQALIDQAKAHATNYLTPRTPAGASGSLKPAIDPASGNVIGWYLDKPTPDGKVRFFDPSDVQMGGGQPTAAPPQPAASVQPQAASMQHGQVAPVATPSPSPTPAVPGTPPPFRSTAPPKKGGGSTQVYPVQIVGADGKPAIYMAPKTPGATQALPGGAGFATDIRAERKGAVAATTPLNNVEVLANQVEAALTKFENTSNWHPVDKAVAQSTYKAQLEALAVPWGRLLGDSRISDQDRQAYARSVGEPSFFLKEMAPEIARERLANLRAVIAEVRQKYGPVLESTEGMLAPVGGGVDYAGRRNHPSPAPSPGTDTGFRVVGVRPARQ